MTEKAVAPSSGRVIMWLSLLVGIFCCAGLIRVEMKLKDYDDKLSRLHSLQMEVRSSNAFVVNTDTINDPTGNSVHILRYRREVSDDDDDTTQKDQNAEPELKVNTLHPRMMGTLGTIVINTAGICAKEESLCLRGPQGVKGETGERGERGKAGKRGLNGITGEKGEKGSIGSPGPPGSKGMQGGTGPQGIQGLVGEKGEPGARGEQGKQGVPGEPGVTGSRGDPGIIGQEGDLGATGPVGPRGPKGEKGDPLSSPSIKDESQDLIKDENSTISMKCSASGNPLPNISWRKYNGTLPRQRHRIYSTGILELRDLMESDSGTYVCTARSILGRSFININLNVRVRPKIKVSPSSVIGEEGISSSFTCTAEGYPPPRITWRKTTGSIAWNRAFSSSGKLTINYLTKEDGGTYLCIATNVVGEAFARGVLIVVDAMTFENVPQEPIYSMQGDKTMLNCQAKGIPKPLLSWKYKDGPLRPNHVVNSDGALEINAASRADEGIYTCSARSLVRTISTDFDFRVEPYARSCSAWRRTGATTSKPYYIDPDGQGGLDPFRAVCNMTMYDSIGVTEISHNAEQRTPVHKRRCKSPGCYTLNLRYFGANEEQMIALTKASLKCEQSIKYECFNTYFLSNDFAWWVSRDGKKMRYFDGDQPNSRTCACSRDNTCFKNRACNCDANDRVAREDSGILRDKNTLPIGQIAFGDVDNIDEWGYHTVGKLRCYGVP